MYGFLSLLPLLPFHSCVCVIPCFNCVCWLLLYRAIVLIARVLRAVALCDCACAGNSVVDLVLPAYKLPLVPAYMAAAANPARAQAQEAKALSLP